MKTINPYDGKVIKEYQDISLEEVNTIILQVHETFLKWKKVPFNERSALMKKAANILSESSREKAILMAEEMGKPILDGISEVNKCAWVCDYYADNAEQFLQDEIIETDASKSYVAYQPLGIVLAVMPWNFPFWQVFRFAAPGLMAGNVGILKHASNVPGCALAIEEVFKKAGFPENAFRTLLVGSKMVNKIIENPLVKAVTLTGSVPAGKAVARKSGSVLKKTVLELGGSDPYIILEDADLENAAKICALSRLINSGQSCIAAKRFIVIEKVRQKFEELFVKEMTSYKMGNPLEDSTKIGPQARIDLRDALHKQVTESIEKGAKCILGGQIPEGKGAFYPPTILTNVKSGMPAYDQELFGPVASIIYANSREEAIKIANDSIFGLGASIFTNNIEEANKIAREEIQSGNCFVNTYVRSDPRLPFGGIKESGYGRELSSHGIKEFINIKTIYIK
ncbi:MAG: NAD-dependent succinate-semialdehyde dehydrogenase [Promethearchaeota archaeon]|jgi:succinate-semialdehyde dehydrogenase/glutarate-semialdehyde dehydrogenase